MFTVPGRTAETNPTLTPRLYSMRADAQAAGGRASLRPGRAGPRNRPRDGTELGLTLPGTLLCGDSHTLHARPQGRAGVWDRLRGRARAGDPTNVQRRPKLMRATFDGTPPP